MIRGAAGRLDGPVAPLQSRLLGADYLPAVWLPDEAIMRCAARCSAATSPPARRRGGNWNPANAEHDEA